MARHLRPEITSRFEPAPKRNQQRQTSINLFYYSNLACHRGQNRPIMGRNPESQHDSRRSNKPSVLNSLSRDSDLAHNVY